ncbi:hypothetical protein ABPG72_012308 [Tetrahymena utriculariae]
MESWQEVKAAIKNDWEKFKPYFTGENKFLNQSQFQQSSPLFITQLAFSLIRTNAKSCGWYLLKCGKGILDIIGHATNKSDSFIADKQSRQNVDYFFSQILYSSLPLARQQIISYYKSLKSQYNYDLIQQIRESSDEAEMIERLENLTVLFKYSLQGMRETFDTKELFDYYEGILKNSNNQQLRALYINLIIKLSSDLHKESILEKVYGSDHSTPDYFQNLIQDQAVVQKLFEKLQKMRNSVISSVVNTNSEQQEQESQSKESKCQLNKDDRSSDEDFLVPKRMKIQEQFEGKASAQEEKSEEFILVSSESQNIDEVKTALLENNFVVLDGPIGAGKTILLNKIASDMKETTISLFIDSTTDLKSLIGSYVCTENIGQFEWKNGPLIKCMEEGMWLILENLSEASEEVLDGLIRCAHEGKYLLASQGRSILAHYKFKIIGLGNFSTAKYESKKVFLMNSCKGGYINKKAINEECLKQILKSRFPNVMKQEDLIYSKIKNIINYLKNDKNLVKKYTYFSRGLSADKIIKLFKRINFHLLELYGDKGIQNNMLVTEIRKRIFLEVMETMVFAEKEAIYDEKMVYDILEVLELPKEEHQLSVLKHYPEIEATQKAVKIGKLGVLQRSFFGKNLDESEAQTFRSTSNIIYNAYSSRLIEKIASCLAFNEPCLLVGDTGCGKTTMAQHVAEQFRKKIYIYNMNQGSDAIDLIGGFKPIDVRLLLKKILVKYIKHFEKVANLEANKTFIDSLTKLYQSKNYATLIKGMLQSIDGIKQKIAKKNLGEEVNEKWTKLEKKLKNLYANKDKIESNLAFHFVEGNLIKAIKQGDWVLIDEINLANNEVLQKLLPIIEGKSLVLYERGDLKEIKRHPMFRIIGCMNPGSDIGKKELPENVRAKFTEIYVHDISEREDILTLVKKKLGSIVEFDVCQKIVDLFMQIKYDSENHQLEDGYNRKTHISLRNLARSLNYIRQNIGLYGPDRTVYDGLYLGFGTALNKNSQVHFEKQLEKLLNISTQKYFDQILKANIKMTQETVNIFGFQVNKGTLIPKKAEECEFLVTDTFKKYIVDLLRAISNSDLPVLLEGPTSAGKTSMVKYIAELAGYKCVRVNNHHHTEIEEYIGTYLPDTKGRLVFHEGVLIEAMKQGHWLILDELNLARSEILESLNRLLDDNKELFVNETQTYIKPHHNFRIFATQNPTSYGGRKELSKAFKNRFVQIYFDDISEKDLEQILQKRCVIAPSYCKRLMSILKDLKVFRQRNNFFLGKEGVITVRDLIKWGNREVQSLEDLAIEGYCLLAERLRTNEEREFIQKIIEKHCKVKIHPNQYYESYSKNHFEPLMGQELPFYLQLNQGFKRMACLVLKSLVNNEPVLLIGETGCGKTTLAQLVAFLRKSQLFSINCHQYTESSDFLGSLRPVRNKEQNLHNLESFLKELNLEASKINPIFDSTLSIDQRVKSISDLSPGQAEKLEQLIVGYETLFEWQDGPLVESMIKGGVFLIDEMNLAEDSVLERLNSVLEPERFLLLPEKSKSKQIAAAQGFIIIATMNPGGDFGKRELSPALRNRFTEIWVEPLTNKNFLIQEEGQKDVVEMIGKFLKIKKVYESEQTRNEIAMKLYEFLRFYNVNFCEKYSLDKKSLTMRDIVALMEFIYRCKNNCSVRDLYYHALNMVVIEPIGFMHLSPSEKNKMTLEIESFIQNQLEQMSIDENEDEKNIEKVRKESAMEIEIPESNYNFVAGSFSIPISQNSSPIDNIPYSISSLKTQSTLEKIVRGLQLDKSILLEGMPGVGKSSVIEYIAAKTQNKLTKISLSEQTDIVDLLGSDLPAASSNEDSSSNKTMKFKWYDGVLLDALKNGYWILLEELNLASQSILEGLNAILDHRGTVFIPEMNMSFTKHPQFRLFAAQNPLSLGGGRKGLPASFMNRFTKIYVEDYTNQEYETILKDLYGEGEGQQQILEGLLRFSKVMETQYYKKINLRDLLRFYELYQKSEKNLEVAFEIAFGRNDVEKYFSSSIMDNASSTIQESHAKKKAAWEMDLRVKIPISYSYIDEHNERIGLLNSQRKPLNFLQMMIERCSKYCSSFIVQGKSGSGKNRLVRLLSQLNSNKKLVEFSLNSQTDSSELIGGYDQVDIKRQFSTLNTRVTALLRAYISSNVSNKNNITDLQLIAVLKQIETLTKNANSYNQKDMLVGIKEALDLLTNLNVSNMNDEDFLQEYQKSSQLLEELKNKIINDEEQQNINSKKGKNTSTSSGHFEWFYSQIIEAVQNGDWLVLDNVGRANQAVLARLNPLLEWNLNGKREIVITECHNEDPQGKSGPEIIRIHPDFRVFFLFDGENDTMNEAIKNKCVEIKIDQYEESKYYSDLQNLFELNTDNEQVPNRVREYILELAMTFMNTLFVHRRSMAYSDFGTFVHFLKLIQRGINMNMIDLNLHNIVTTSFKSAYGPKGIKYAINLDGILSNIVLSNNDEDQISSNTQRQKAFLSNIPEIVRDSFTQQLELLLNQCSWSSSLNFSEFPLNRELHRYKALGKTLFSNDTQKSNSADNGQNNLDATQKAKIQENFARVILQQCFADYIIQYISGVDASVLRRISQKEYSSEALYQQLLDEFEAIRIRRKVFAATQEFKKTKEFILSNFQKALQSLNSLSENINGQNESAFLHAQSVVQCAMLQAVRNIQQLPKIYQLVSQKLNSIIQQVTQTSSDQNNQLPEQAKNNIQQVEENIFVCLWRACEYFESMPRSKIQYEQREKVHYLLSSKNVQSVDFSDHLQEMINLRKSFRNMYYLENSKTRLTSMEILALIYNLKKTQNDQNEEKTEQQEILEEKQRTEQIFNAFKAEVFKILDSQNKSQQETQESQNPEQEENVVAKKQCANEFEIVIEEEYSRTILKTIPVLASDKGIQYWELKMQEQIENYESSFFDNQCFNEMREYFVFKGIEKFSLADESQNTLSTRENVKLNIVDHIDRPDYYVMRIFQLFKNEITINELVEIFYLAQMKNRNIDSFRLKRCAKVIQDIKLKHLPLLNREINLLRSAINFSLSIKTAEQEQNEEEQEQKELNDLFVLAYVWLLNIFQRVNKNKSKKQNESQQAESSNIGKNLYKKISLFIQKNNVEGIMSIQEEILLINEHNNKFLHSLCQRVNDELSILLRQNELLKLGLIIIRLFSINKSYFEIEGFEQRDCLSELLKEDYEFQYEEASYLDKLNDYVSLCVIEKALTNTIDFTETTHTTHIEQLKAQQQTLKNIKKRMIYRGYQGDNITSFSEFFEESIPFIQRIENFLPNLQSLHISSASTLSFEDLRQFIEIKKHIDNWLHISFEKYYAPFSDFLIPLHFGLILVKQYISQILSKSKIKEAQISLISESTQDRIDQFKRILWQKKNIYKLKNCDNILKNIRLNDQLFEDTEEMKDFCAQIMCVASENLMQKEELDKLAEDDTTKLIKATRQLEKMIVDEYKKETVEEYKEKERQEIQEAFNTFSKDYIHLLQVDLTIQEKIELQQQQQQGKDNNNDDNIDEYEEDLEEVKMEELTMSELNSIKQRSLNSIIEILNIYDNCRNKKNILYSDQATVAAVTDNSEKKRSLKSLTSWKDFTFSHKIEYIKISLVQNLFPHDPLSQVLEYSSAFGQVQKTNQFEECMKKKSAIQQLDTSQVQFNVYKDIIPSENVKIFKPVMNLLNSIRRLLHEEDIFDNNAVLQNLAILCDYTLEQSVLTTPLNKIITGLQFIAEKVEEWNLSTAKAYSLNNEINPIVELLLYWRKLERRCWKFMLSEKDKEIELLDVVMFLKLRNLVVSSNGNNAENRESLFKIVDQFIRTAVMGNFGLRMKGLYYLSYCDVEVQKLSLQELLQQVYKYYMQFYAQYSTALQQNRAEHEKDCEEYVTLAGWESKNYITLKATVDKFQGKVHRIVKRYRDFLQEPISRHIFDPTRNLIFAENYESFRLKYEKVFIEEDSEYQQTEHHIMKYQVQENAEKVIQIGRKLLLQNCLSVPPIKHYKQCQVVEKPDELCAWLYKEQMISQVFERVKDLTQEEVTRNMKFKAVLDIFKYLKSLGFTSYFLNTSQLMGDNTVIYDMRSIKLDTSLLGAELTNYLSQDIHYIEKCYYTTLDKICVLRFNSNYHEDLTKDNIRRGCGFLIEYFYYIKRIYLQLNSLFKNSSSFISFVENMSIVSQSSNVHQSKIIIIKNYEQIKEEVENFLNKIIFLCSEVKQVISFIPTSSDMEINSLRTLCETTLASLSSTLNGKLVEIFSYEELISNIHKISEKLRANASKASKLGFSDLQVIIQNSFRQASSTLLVLQRSLEQTIQEANKEENGEPQNLQEEKIIKDLQLFAQGIIKTVQSYKNNLKLIIEDIEEEPEEQAEGAEAKEPVNHTDDASTASVKNHIESDESANTILKTQQPEFTFIQNEERILKKLNKSIEDFCYKLTQLYESEILKQVSKKSYNTIYQMLIIIQLYLKNTILYHTKSIKAQSKFMNLLGIIFYNLVYKGFCQPKNQGDEGAGSDDEDGKYEMKDGTGIGEGKGQENVSKEIEFEEQVLGNRDEEEVPEEEENQDNKEEQKKEDDYEMDQDFKGTTSKPEDMNEEEEDQANKDGDEQFSDVDEDELDFKMWEGDDNKEGEEEQEDKQDEKQNRKKEDIEFKSKDKPQGEENDRAKEEEKEKEDQRNIDNFEKTEREEKEDEINEQKNAPEEDEQNVDKEDEDAGKEKNKKDQQEEAEEEEENEDEEGEHDGKEGEQLDPELMKQQMELEEEEEVNDDHQDGGSQEGDLEDDMEDAEDGENNDNIDPLENVSDFENEEDEEHLEDENKNTALENDDMDIEEQDQDDQDEEREYPKDIKKNQKQKQKKQEKKFGVEGDDDQIQMEEDQEETDDNKENKQKGQNEEQEDDKKNRNDGQDQDQNNSSNQNKFSLDFLQQIIEKTQPNAKDLQNFFKDLNVVQDQKEDQQNQQQQQQPQTKEDQFNEEQEFEAFNPQDYIDPEELKNMLATNVSAQEMKNASNIPQEMHNEDQMDQDMPQPQQPPKPEGENQKKEESSYQQPKKNQEKDKKNDGLNKKEKQEQIDFLEEQKNMEEKEKAEKEKKKEQKNVNQENDENLQESEIPQQNSQLEKNNQKKDEEKIEEEEDENLLSFLEDENETVEQKRDRMLKLIQECKNNPEKFQKGQELWQKIENEARYFSVQLCEELKAVLEPTLIASFKGDYKSGKRLNMKKIIPYIASNFRKDKIWLRRNEPSKRTYQILLAIDDSLSMSQQNVGYFALQSMTILSLAMSKMEVGQIGIAAIKDGLQLLHDFNTPLTPADSPFILSQFSFTHSDTNSSDLDLVKFMKSTIETFKEAKGGSKDTHQICFIMSDGRFNKKLVKPLIQEAEENNQLFVFIVLDKSEDKESIMNIKSTSQKYVNGKLQIEMKHYLEDFPYKYYIIVKDVHELSKVLVDILRQYYEMKSNS